MIKMISLLLSFSFSFIFIGCTPKTQIVFKPKYMCVEQQILDKQEPISIRIHKDDRNIALEYKSLVDESLDFYESQVVRNNKICKEIEK